MIDFNEKNILVTGGAGFIGSNLALYLQKNFPKCQVVVFDRFRSTEKFDNGNLKSLGHFKNLVDFKGEIVCGDITKKEDLEKLTSRKFDYIFHQAAISDTTASEQDEIIKTNVEAFKDIILLAKSSAAQLIYASSASVYGNLPAPHTVGKEKPLNCYAFSKLMMDNIANEISKKTSLKIIGLRYFNVYGPREFFKGKTASTVLQFGLQLLSNKPPRLFKGSDKIKRDFVYVSDVIKANILSCEASCSGVFNVGCGEARSFQEIADILQEALGTSFSYEYIPNPYKKQYQFFTEADIALSAEKLGYVPEYDLKKGILDYLPEIKRIFEEEIGEA